MKKFDSINVIPFIDIMLVLLAIVLATASFIVHQKIEVNIPQSHSKTKVESKDLVELITITKDGEYFYQDQPITIEALDEKLSLLKVDTQITVKIDAESYFQQFVRVTDILTKYELKKVTVVTTKVATQNAPESAL
ncbi:MAG: TonB system transport protein ExbD [Gammaproteobacteria bacterium]|nr:MAG: TonB system transport protein ExbD [Gammaproteobacteria bacterium]